MSRTKELFALLLCLLCPLMAVSVGAVGAEIPPLAYELTADGNAVRTGDVITVTFRLRRTDGSDGEYRLRALQNEILYDQDFFAYVDGSAQMLKSGGSVLFQTRIDGTHIIKASYLSQFGGEFQAEEAFCSFRLRVIAEGGSGWVANDGECAIAFGIDGAAALIVSGGDGAESAPVRVTCSRFLNLPNAGGRIPLLLAVLTLVLLTLALTLASVVLCARTEDAALLARRRRILTASASALLLLAAALCTWMLAAAW